MKFFKNIEDLNVKYYELFEDKANCIDFLSKRFSKKIDKELMRDYKKSLKLFIMNDRIEYKKVKKTIKSKCNSISIFSIFKKFFKKK